MGGSERLCLSGGVLRFVNLRLVTSAATGLGWVAADVSPRTIFQRTGRTNNQGGHDGGTAALRRSHQSPRGTTGPRQTLPPKVVT